MSRPRYELRTSQIQAKSFTALANLGGDKTAWSRAFISFYVFMARRLIRIWASLLSMAFQASERKQIPLISN
jgi:hypothetical protein